MDSFEIFDEQELSQFISERLPSIIQTNKKEISIKEDIMKYQFFFEQLYNKIEILKKLQNNNKELLKFAIEGFKLIQIFHNELTGENLHYLITSGNKKLKERFISWEELIPSLTIRKNKLFVKLSELDKIIKQEEVNNKTQKILSSVEAWKKIAEQFQYKEDYSKKESTKNPYMSLSGNAHNFYRRLKNKSDTKMIIFYSTDKNNGRKMIRYSYEKSVGNYWPAFMAGNLKEWFDKKYLVYKENGQASEWLNNILNQRHPIGELLQDQDNDRGSLAGDFRINKQMIIQDKLRNTKILTIEQISDSLIKISSLLKVFIENESDINAENLIKIFFESDIDDELAKEIIADTKIKLGLKNIKI